MRRYVIALLSVLLTAALCSAAFAAVQGSHHDMGAWGGGGSGVDTCYPCHGIKAETTGQDSALGTVGNLCYLRCHVGSTGAAGTIRVHNRYPEVGYVTDNTAATWAMTATGANGQAAANGYENTATVVDKYKAGHGMVVSLIPSPEASTQVSGLSWPYVAETDLQCTSCHDVHSNTYTPFLRAPLADNNPISAGFCTTCHSKTDDGSARWVSIANAPNGSHPIEVVLTAGTIDRAGVNGRNARRMGFIDSVGTDNGAVFRNASYSGTALNDKALSYNPGGKLSDFSSGGTNARIGCYTCHAAHLPSVSGHSQQIVAQWKGNGTRSHSPMCVGCHGNGYQSGRNPGGTDYSHPVNSECRPQNIGSLTAAVYQVTTGTFSITVNVDNVDRGASGMIVCSSCHGDTTAASKKGVHAGPAATMILSPQKPSCAACHGGGSAKNMGTTPNSHHVYGGTTDYTGSGYGYPAKVRYNNAKNDNAILTDGLSCEDCHVFNGTAHNWN